MVCRNFESAIYSHFVRRLRLGICFDLSQWTLAAVFGSFFCRRTNGTDQLLDAICRLHLILLPLHHRALRASWAGLGSSTHGHSFCCPDRLEQLVASSLPLWPYGVAVARPYLRQVSPNAKRRTCRHASCAGWSRVSIGRAASARSATHSAGLLV